MLCETGKQNKKKQHHSSPENGQRYSSDVYKQDGWHPFSRTLPASPDYLELVSAAEHILAPSRGEEHSRRRGVQEYEGSLRLDVEFPCLQADSAVDGGR